MSFIPLKQGKHYQSFSFKCIINLTNKHLCSQLIEVTTFPIDESSPFPESAAQEVYGLSLIELQGTCIFYFPLNGFWRLSNRKRVFLHQEPLPAHCLLPNFVKHGKKLVSSYRKENENYCPVL